MKINEVTEGPRSSIYDPNAEKLAGVRRLGQQITNALEPKSGVKWPDDEVWNKASMLGTMLSELPDGQAKTPGEALKKAGVSKDELDDIMAKAKQARKVAMPDPEPSADPEDDDELDDKGPSDDEIDRDAKMYAKG
jgi:hypothetical protein|tara:strand:+ start:471 stop:878 length:408 start_codon:yes stop_codon:yes gene_type:complete